MVLSDSLQGPKLLRRQHRVGVMLLSVGDHHHQFERDSRALKGTFSVRPDLSSLRRIRHGTRRAEWVAGRDCIGQVIAHCWPRVVDKSIIVAESIGRSNGGMPRLISASRGPKIHLSISHRSGLVASMASVSRCGIDVEAIDEAPRRAVTAVFSEEERGIVEAGLGTSLGLEASAFIWTLYEALSKAIGTPVVGAGRQRIIDVSQREGGREINFEMESPLDRSGIARLTGSSIVFEEFVVTLVTANN